jgi:beta-glucanase (GH16 family)
MKKLAMVAVVAILAGLAVAVVMSTGQAASTFGKAPKEKTPAPAPAPAVTTPAAPVAPTAAPPAARPGWTLVWTDEFDTPGLVNPKKWNYEEGMLRNGEKQYYTKARLENCRVENGALIITAIKEKGPGGKGDYTSASIETKGLASWTYGRIEMRAKLPQGRGTWPAFWTLGNQGGWPSCGEIDIMEFVGYEPNKVYSTLHWNAGGHKQKGNPFSVKAPFNDFHVYAVEWYPDRIDSYFDETKFGSIPLSVAQDGSNNAFKKPHYIKLNFAVGGDWGAAKGIDESIWPQKYIVDYVRVYQKPGAGQ